MESTNKRRYIMYTIEQLSCITGLTTRTLRNYLKSNILQGSKDTGMWHFTEEQVSDFIHHPAVYPSIQAKHHAIVYDFLAGQDNGENEICVLLDLKLDRGKAQQTADFFCNAANTLSHIRFAFSYKSGKGRYILKGTEDEIRQIMQEYYSR